MQKCIAFVTTRRVDEEDEFILLITVEFECCTHPDPHLLLTPIHTVHTSLPLIRLFQKLQNLYSYSHNRHTGVYEDLIMYDKHLVWYQKTKNVKSFCVRFCALHVCLSERLLVQAQRSTFNFFSQLLFSCIVVNSLGIKIIKDFL